MPNKPSVSVRIIKKKRTRETLTGDKRQYVPGTVIESECPKCGMKNDCDLDENYLCYPPIGEPFGFDFECDEWDEEAGEQKGCGHEWQVKLQLDFVLKAC